ncbi:hypothetical protein VTK56DRAFT_4345 [Thermocarpiscus australiensis]
MIILRRTLRRRVVPGPTTPIPIPIPASALAPGRPSPTARSESSRRGIQGELEGHRSTLFWAFGLLRDGDNHGQGLLVPRRGGRATGRTNFQAIADAIASAPGCRPGSHHLAAFNTFALFLRQHSCLHSHLRPPLEMDMSAVDLVPPESDQSRLKICFRDRRTDFASVREVMPLGGQVRSPSFERGMVRLRLQQARRPREQPWRSHVYRMFHPRRRRPTRGGLHQPPSGQAERRSGAPLRDRWVEVG